MATSLENNFWEPLIAMVVYGLSSLVVAIITTKSLKFRRIVSGRTKILLDDGKFYRKNFVKARIDLSEFLAQCRINGYFNINDLQTAILEENGKISFTSNPIRSKAPYNNHYLILI